MASADNNARMIVLLFMVIELLRACRWRPECSG